MFSITKRELKLPVSRWQFCSPSLTLRTSVVENRFQVRAVPNQYSINLEVGFFPQSLKTCAFKKGETNNYVLLPVYFPLQWLNLYYLTLHPYRAGFCGSYKAWGYVTPSSWEILETESSQVSLKELFSLGKREAHLNFQQRMTSKVCYIFF